MIGLATGKEGLDVAIGTRLDSLNIENTAIGYREFLVDNTFETIILSNKLEGQISIKETIYAVKSAGSRIIYITNEDNKNFLSEFKMCIEFGIFDILFDPININEVIEMLQRPEGTFKDISKLYAKYYSAEAFEDDESKFSLKNLLGNRQNTDSVVSEMIPESKIIEKEVPVYIEKEVPVVIEKVKEIEVLNSAIINVFSPKKRGQTLYSKIVAENFASEKYKTILISCDTKQNILEYIETAKYSSKVNENIEPLFNLFLNLSGNLDLGVISKVITKEDFLKLISIVKNIYDIIILDSNFDTIKGSCLTITNMNLFILDDNIKSFNSFKKNILAFKEKTGYTFSKSFLVFNETNIYNKSIQQIVKDKFIREFNSYVCVSHAEQLSNLLYDKKELLIDNFDKTPKQDILSLLDMLKMRRSKQSILKSFSRFTGSLFKFIINNLPIFLLYALICIAIIVIGVLIKFIFTQGNLWDKFILQ